MKTEKHNLNRLKRTPEWQAWERHCEIHNRKVTYDGFLDFAVYQRVNHLLLLMEMGGVRVNY